MINNAFYYQFIFHNIFSRFSGFSWLLIHSQVEIFSIGSNNNIFFDIFLFWLCFLSKLSRAGNFYIEYLLNFENTVILQKCCVGNVCYFNQWGLCACAYSLQFTHHLFTLTLLRHGILNKQYKNCFSLPDEQKGNKKW